MWLNAWASMRMDKEQRWWSYEWNFAESVRSQMKLPEKIIVKDDTLREGEETPGTYFTIDQKVEIAKLLEEMGIKEIEVGYAAGIKEHSETFKALKKEGIKMKLSSHARMYVKNVKKEVDDILASEADYINFLLVPSPTLKTKKEVFERITEGIEYAKSQGAYVAFGSGRVIPRFWEKFLQLAVDAKVDRVVVYDGNGCALPLAFKESVVFTKNIVKDIPIEVHTHNDLGLAVATTLAGVEGGAEVVDVVFNGLGDRLLFIEMVRHPIGMIRQQTLNMERLLNNPRYFTIFIKYKNKSIPYYTKGWEKEFIDANPVEKTILSINNLTSLKFEIYGGEVRRIEEKNSH